MGVYDIALVVLDPGHGATSNTKADLEELGHTVTVITDDVTTLNGTDWTLYDTIVVCRACETQAKTDPIIAAWEAGTRVLWGSPSGFFGGDNGLLFPATFADLTGTWAAQGNTDNRGDITDNQHPVTDGLSLGIFSLYLANNFQLALDVGVSHVGVALASSSPNLSTEPSLIAVEQGTERLNSAGPTPTRCVVWGDIYAGQSRYTTDGKTILQQSLDWVAITPGVQQPDVTMSATATVDYLPDGIVEQPAVSLTATAEVTWDNPAVFIEQPAVVLTATSTLTVVPSKAFTDTFAFAEMNLVTTMQTELVVEFSPIPEHLVTKEIDRVSPIMPVPEEFDEYGRPV